jgi:hypothetical protein
VYTPAGVPAAAVYYHVRTDVSCKFSVASFSYSLHPVYKHTFVLSAHFHRSFAVGIVPVITHEAIVVDGQQTVFFVPEQLPDARSL